MWLLSPDPEDVTEEEIKLLEEMIGNLRSKQLEMQTSQVSH